MDSERDTRVDIELIKKDISVITTFCDRLSTTIDKMQDIAANLTHMVALQQQKLDIQERTTKEIESTLEMRRIEHNNEIKELHSRITTVNRELTEKIEETEIKILTELHAIRADLKKEDDTLGKRLFNIETWKWMIMGGLFLLGWFASNILSKLKIY